MTEHDKQLLEFYAGQALTGMLSHSKRYQPRKAGQNWHDAIAEEAFEIAESMMRRGKSNLMVATNIKTGEKYQILHGNVKNATSGHEKDEGLVLYEKGESIFVRSASEFHKKFNYGFEKVESKT